MLPKTGGGMHFPEPISLQNPYAATSPRGCTSLRPSSRTRHVVLRGNDRRAGLFQAIDHVRCLDELQSFAQRLGCASMPA